MPASSNSTDANNSNTISREPNSTVQLPTTHDFLEEIREKLERRKICEKRNKKS
jgi:hypothetical protein